MLVIDWLVYQSAYYPYVWLRDNDRAGFHLNTKQRLFDLTSINLEDDLGGFEVAPGSIRLSGLLEDHTVEFTLSWLYYNHPGKTAADPAASDARGWRCDLGASDTPRTPGNAILTKDSALLSWLSDTQDHG